MDKRRETLNRIQKEKEERKNESNWESLEERKQIDE